MMTCGVPGQQAAEVARRVVRASMANQIVQTVQDATRKVRRRLPTVTVVCTLGEPSERDLCFAHRDWSTDGHTCGLVLNASLGTRDALGRCQIRPIQVRELVVTAAGLPMRTGWTVVGVLVRDATDMVAAYTVTGTPAAQSAHQYVNLAGQCTHCRTNRRRQRTVLLASAVGAVHPYGAACLKEVTGGVLSAAALDGFFSLRSLVDTAMDAPTTAITEALDTVLALTSAVVGHFGEYIPTTAAFGQDGEPTAWVVSKLITGQIQPTPDYACPTDADRAIATEVMTWVREGGLHRDGEPASDYAANAARVVEHGEVTLNTRNSTIGLATSLLAIYRRDQERRARADAATQRVRAHIGEPGQRREFSGTARSVREHDGRFDTRTHFVLDTAEGTVIWWASGAFDINDGDEMTVTATIKAHETYRDEPQTVITRGTVH